MAAPKKTAAKPAKKVERRGAKKGDFGNKPYVATDEQKITVEAMVAAGAEQWFIAEHLAIDVHTLRKHFRPQLDEGKNRVDWKVGGNIAQRAMAGDPDMMKFYAARRAGWKTTTELTGANGGPIEYRSLSDEELDARIAALTGNAAAVEE